MKKLAGDKAKLIDLGGRTVIPGLTDGHIHGIRAALTFGTEVNWIGVTTLKEALEKIRQAAKSQKPGSWIVVAGGWTEEPFGAISSSAFASPITSARQNQAASLPICRTSRSCFRRVLAIRCCASTVPAKS